MPTEATSVPGARYEFRCWPDDLSGETREALAAAERAERTVSRETYLLLPGTSEYLIKFRAGVLEVKRRVARTRGLELWTVDSKTPLPLDGASLTDHALLLSSLAPSGWGHGWTFASAHACVAALQSAYPALSCPRIGKVRQRYRLDGCLAECTMALTPWGRRPTIAVESEAPGAVLDGIARLGLAGAENRDYGAKLRDLNLWASPASARRSRSAGA